MVVAIASSRPAAADRETALAGGTDLVRSYLRDIGRVPLLTHEQEITLGRQVQELVALEVLEQELASREGVEKPSPAVLAKEAGLTQVQLKKRLRSGPVSYTHLRAHET